MQKKYFGDGNPVGENLKIDFEEWKVTAVYADPPQHFHLKLNYLLFMVTTGGETRDENNWQQHRFVTYLKLKPGTDHKALEAKFKSFVEKYAYPIIEPKGFTYVPYLQNIQDIHLHSSQFEWEIAQRGNIFTVYILAGKNLGFNKEQLVVVPLTTDQLKNQEVTKRKYSDHPNVISATIGFGLPGDIIAGDEVINPEDGKILPARLFVLTSIT